MWLQDCCETEEPAINPGKASEPLAYRVEHNKNKPDDKNKKNKN